MLVVSAAEQYSIDNSIINYVHSADFNGDNKIDINDAFYVLKNINKGNCGATTPTQPTKEIIIPATQTGNNIFEGMIYSTSGDSAKLKVDLNNKILVFVEDDLDKESTSLKQVSPNEYVGSVTTDDNYWKFQFYPLDKLIVVSVTGEGAKEITSQPPSTQQPTTQKYIGSCKDSCGKKTETPGGNCYCDEASLKYGDSCSDLKQYCPEIWNKNK